MINYGMEYLQAHVTGMQLVGVNACQESGRAGMHCDRAIWPERSLVGSSGFMLG